MKISENFKILFLIILTSLFAGCDLFNSEETPVAEDNYLVSFEKYKTFKLLEIKVTLNAFSFFYPELTTIKDNAQHDIAVYKITYNTKFKGNDIVASGLVAVPTNSGSYPILSYQNGTNTLHSEAPSANPDNELFQLLQFIASTGFVVAAPDYLGFGASSNMFHPYLDKESTIQSVVDMLRATDELATNHLKTEITKDLYIAGYSQGGWATMQLQKAIEQNYSSEFNLKASSCGAGPYDLRYFNDYVLSLSYYPMPYFIGYVFNSYMKLGEISNPAGDIFKSPYAQRITTLYDGTKTGDEINSQLTTATADLFTGEFKNFSSINPKFSSVISGLNKNSIPAWKTNTPTLMTHGTADTYVPEQISINMYNEFLARGVSSEKITYLKFPDAGHTTAIIPSGIATFNWFIDVKNSM